MRVFWYWGGNICAETRCEGGGGVKIYLIYLIFRPKSAECDGNSEKCQNTHECGWIVQDKSLQLIYLNKQKHPMLVISRLQPRNSNSEKVSGLVCYEKSKMEYIFMPSRVYILVVDLINFLNYIGDM